MMDILKQCMEEWDFKGIKIYPSVGYFPYDVRLRPMYVYAENHDIPIISHCSPYNPTYNRSWPYEIKAMLSDSKIPLDRDTCNRKRLCSNFTNPLNFPFVMDELKKLRICLAIKPPNGGLVLISGVTWARNISGKWRLKIQYDFLVSDSISEIIKLRWKPVVEFRYL